jgi:hypothetical protein
VFCLIQDDCPKGSSAEKCGMRLAPPVCLFCLPEQASAVREKNASFHVMWLAGIWHHRRYVMTHWRSVFSSCSTLMSGPLTGTSTDPSFT